MNKYYVMDLIKKFGDECEHIGEARKSDTPQNRQTFKHHTDKANAIGQLLLNHFTMLQKIQNATIAEFDVLNKNVIETAARKYIPEMVEALSKNNGNDCLSINSALDCTVFEYGLIVKYAGLLGISLQFPVGQKSS